MISESEYKMVREEIFFYQSKNQEVRNMMYAITIAYLGLVYSPENKHSFLYLVPLAIIIPSYMISYDYLVCICRAATYLMVFGEKGKNPISHWERRIRKFNNGTKQGIHIHRLPYIGMMNVCLILYMVNGEEVMWIRMGIALICFCTSILIFSVYRKIDEKKNIRRWEKIKREFL